MFTPSSFTPQSAPFSEIAGDLYLPPSFEPPPPRGPLPEGPAEWMYFGEEVRQPPDAASERETGEAKDTQDAGETLAANFSRFRASDRFKQAQRQIVDRIEQCERFAAAHCSEVESTTIRDALSVLKRHVMDRDGDAYFDPSQLQLLYSLGKRCLDDVCLLLEQPTIDVFLRRTVLRELAQQATTCRGAGPAFIEASHALRQPEGTLRGEYWRVLKDMFDDAVLRFVRGLHVDQNGAWPVGMEVHMVNRLRLELGLPGARPEDHLSYGTLLPPGAVPACAAALLHRCRPATVAAALAADYRARLLDLAREPLGVVSEIDPNDTLHMEALTTAARRLSATFDGVSLNSVLEQDVETGDFRWRHDDALLTRDLLNELARQRLIRPPVVGTAVCGTTTDSEWSLRHLDQRVPYVQELIRGAGGLAEFRGVRLRELGQLLSRPVSEPLRGQAVMAVLRGETPDALMSFAPDWLRHPGEAERLLGRLGQDRAVQWLRRHPPEGSATALILFAATASRLDRVLSWLLRPAHAIALRLMGPSVLANAVKSGAPEIVRIWVHWLGERLRELSPHTVLTCLTDEDGQPLAVCTLRQGQANMTDDLLGLVVDAQARGKLSIAQAVDQCRSPLQLVMQAGHLEALRIWGGYAARAGRAGWLSSPELRALLEGGVTQAGCRGAMLGEQAAVVEWFQQTVVQLADEQLLAPSDAAALLTGAGADRTSGSSSGMLAVVRGDAESFGAYFRGVIEGARRGWFTAEQLMDLLACLGSPEFSGLAILWSLRDGGIAQQWRDLVRTAGEEGLLSAEQICALLSSPAYQQTMQPFLHGSTLTVSVVLPGGRCRDHATLDASTRVMHWGCAVVELARVGVLTRPWVVRALASEQDGVPAFHAWMHRSRNSDALWALQGLFLQARRQQVIDDDELLHLLEARTDGGHGQSGFFGVTESTIRVVLERMIEAVRQRALPAEVVTRLVTRVAAARFADPALREERQAFERGYERQIQQAAK